MSTRRLCTSDAQTQQFRRLQEDSEAIDHNLDQSEFRLMELKPCGWVRNMFRRESNAPQRSSAGNRSRSSPGFAAPGGHSSFSQGQAWRAWGSRTATSTASPIEDSAVPRKVGSAGAAPLWLLAGRKCAAADSKKVANGRRPEQKNTDIDKSYEDIIPDITDAAATDHERMNRQSQNMRERLLG